MFSLHETTQRRICRTLFIVCAVVPAVITLAWVTYSQRPWLETDWQRSLSQQLHVRVAVEHVASPKPGMRRLKNVRLADLRSELPLGSIDRVSVQCQGSQLTLAADQLRIEAEHLPALAATIATCMSASELPAAKLQIERLAIVGQEKQTLALSNVRLHSENENPRTGLRVQAELSGTGQGGAPPTVRLLVERHGKTTTATLDTGGAHLPSWVLVDLLPSVARCAEATYSGSVRLESDTEQTSGSLHGRFENLALEQWVGAASPHQVQAIGRVELDQFQWREQRVEVAHGNLQASRGIVSHSLLADFKRRLFCVPGPGIANLQSVVGDGLLPFDELSCGFHMTGAGLTLTGRCRTIRDGAPGCLLASEGEPLMLEPQYANLPVAQLVQVLSQPAASWLPASREANEMAGKLPLPRVGPQPKEEVATQPKESTAR
ncbi:MAG: hypothetical protein ACR2NU_00920 [Aeoliella sp.]